MLATWGCTTFPKPTLSLDFLGATSLDSGITFSRGSQATLFDSTGTLVYAKHNLLLQSQAFDLANWVKNNGATVTANAGAAPDGTITADQFNGAASPSTGVFAFPAGAQSNIAYTFSVYVKNVSAATTLTIGCDANPSNAKVTFNAVTGVITAAGANVTSSSVYDMGSGWYRVVVRFTTTSTAPGFVIYADTGALATWLVWGAQLNLANMEGGVTSSLSTYYPTTTAAYYAPRFDYDPSTLQPRGLLIEEQRTNSIRNNTMQGAVAGTPGTAPTNWAIGAIGLSSTIVGTGTENGITYVDIRLFGTTTSQFGSILFETATGIAASPSQSWTNSVYLKLVAGTVNGLSQVGVGTYYYNSTPTLFGNNTAQVTLTSTLTRYTLTATTPATTAYVRPLFYFNGANASGDAVDFTVRIGLPQLELGAFATSVIPTTTTALTRNADVASMTGTNFSSWFNAGSGTFYARHQKLGTVNFQRVCGVSDGGFNNRIGIGYSSGSPNNLTAFVTTSAVSQASLTLASPSAINTDYKTAFAYATDDFAASLNGGAVQTDTSGTIPTVDRFNIGIGDNTSSNPLNGWIARLAYYPTRLPDATLQALTA